MEHVTLPYLVFPCSQCGKFTYAKVNQKARKCGICGKTMTIGQITDGFPAKNVNDAAKLAMTKNHGWLATKGIQITPEKKPVGLPGNPKPQSSVKPPSSPHQLIYEKIQLALRAEGITNLTQVPLPYLHILYDQHATPPKQFDQFYAFFQQTLKSHPSR